MIELMLQAERAMAMGLVDQAERMYRQAAAADPRNSIAVVGLARVALEREDDVEAYRQAKRALTIDPENVAAARLADRLEEVYAYRGQALPGMTIPAIEAAAEPPPQPGAALEPAPELAQLSAPSAPSAPSATPSTSPAPPVRRSLIDRLLRRNRP
jgi:tetratricopeptide (TPR) repeat protein